MSQRDASASQTCLRQAVHLLMIHGNSCSSRPYRILGCTLGCTPCNGMGGNGESCGSSTPERCQSTMSTSMPGLHGCATPCATTRPERNYRPWQRAHPSDRKFRPFAPPPRTLRRWRSGPTPIPLALPPLPLHRMSMGANAITLLGANALTSPLAQQHA